MQLAFQDQLFLQVIVYLDDIIIFSKTLEEHITRLESVFDKLQEYGLQIEPAKCRFFLPEVIFLGHKVSASGISIDPVKTEAITSWKTLGNSQELLSFLSTVAYLRRYVKDFSKIAAPLHRLINEDPNQGKRKRPGRKWKHHSSAWNWDQECQQAFIENSDNDSSSVGVCRLHPTFHSGSRRKPQGTGNSLIPGPRREKMNHRLC